MKPKNNKIKSEQNSNLKKVEDTNSEKKGRINIEEKILKLSEEIKNLEHKNLELGQEILKSSLYIKKYIKMRRIFAGIKWTLLGLILILGFLSMNFIFDYLQDILNSYQGQINQIVEQTNNIRR